MQMDFIGAKPAAAEGPVEGSQSPAADFIGRKKAAGRVEQGAEGFARTLEKARGIGEAAGAQAPGAAAAPGQERTKKGLEDLLSGLNEQQLVRVLMQINPQELLRFAKSLGLDPAGLLASGELASGEPAGSSRLEATGRANKTRLIDLISALSELLGGKKVIDAVIAAAGRKELQSPQQPTGGSAAAVKDREATAPRGLEKKARVVVLDLRKEQVDRGEVREQSASVKNAFKLTMERAAETQGRDASVLFRAPVQDRTHVSSLQADPRAERAGQNFQQRFVPEVVKQTGIILKEGGNGEIRLVLKPENLGSIRIRVALSESSLEGRIVVENNSVKELVESSLDNLRNALRLEGYQTNLEVSVGHRRSWSGSDPAQDQPIGRMAAGSEEFDKAVPLYLDMRPDYELVNVFA